MNVQRDEEEVVPIPLDRETIARLARFARASGKPACAVAAALLRDLLIDDELAHRHDQRPTTLHS